MNKIKLVAELGINHNGDLKIAKQLIDIAKTAGCDYVKFQKRTIDLVYTEEELNKYRESPWGTTNRQQKEGLEFSKEDYDWIDMYCKQVGIEWFASPWDIESVKFLAQYGLPFIKIASACVVDSSILAAIVGDSNSSVIISTGMSTGDEVIRCTNNFGKRVEYILACTSTYPTANYEMNLSFITTLKQLYPGTKVGFSNHSPGIMYMVVAAALGAKMLEFHITLDRSMPGSDQAASIEPEGVFKLVKHVRNLEKAMGDGNWKVYPSEEKIKEKLRKW